MKFAVRLKPCDRRLESNPEREIQAGAASKFEAAFLI